MSRADRALATLAAVCCGLAVAAAAYASHAAHGLARERMTIAAAMAFGHGLALLLPLGPGRLWLAARLCWASGIVLFAGSLAAAALWSSSTALAPAGGMSLLLGWGILAVHTSRRS